MNSSVEPLFNRSDGDAHDTGAINGIIVAIAERGRKLRRYASHLSVTIITNGTTV